MAARQAVGLCGESATIAASVAELAVSAPSYYANVNPELLLWMPLDARRVLEVGCGEAALAAAYKARNPRATYVAVELHGPAASVARTRVDHLIEGDFAGMDLAAVSAHGPFDAIVLGDVLEHMADPWAVLRRLGGLLATDGVLAISVPNAGHWTVLAELVAGRWPAQDQGLFDRTHLRWFTLDSLRAVLEETGHALVRGRSRKFLLNEAQAQAWIPRLADVAERAQLDRQAFIDRAQTLQYVVNARRADASPLAPALHVHFATVTPDFLDARMRQPFEALHSEPRLTLSWRERNAALPPLPPEQPKVAVVQRLPLDAPTAARYVEDARRRGWVLVFEMDDHPELIGQVHRSNVGDLLVETLRRFDAVQTSTPALAQVLSAYGPPVRVFPNALMELPAAAPRRPGPPRVFHGALNREGFTSRVAAALAPLLDRRPDVTFDVVHDRAFFDALPTAAKRFHPACAYPEYLALMAGCDIVLSPLEGRPEEQFKSDIKYLEAARAGAAFLASPAVYAATVRDGFTGLIVPDVADWPERLGSLIDDETLRLRLRNAARDEVQAGRMAAYQVAPRAEWYRELWDARAELAEAARRRAP